MPAEELSLARASGGAVVLFTGISCTMGGVEVHVHAASESDYWWAGPGGSRGRIDRRCFWPPSAYGRAGADLHLHGNDTGRHACPRPVLDGGAEPDRPSIHRPS